MEGGGWKVEVRMEHMWRVEGGKVNGGALQAWEWIPPWNGNLKCSYGEICMWYLQDVVE